MISRIFFSFVYRQYLFFYLKNTSSWSLTVVPNGKKSLKKSSTKVIFTSFSLKVLKIYITSVSGCLSFTFKICEIVAYTSMIQQFHEFFESLFGVFFKFGPTLRHKAWSGVKCRPTGFFNIVAGKCT
jgi:hypothetical protein